MEEGKVNDLLTNGDALGGGKTLQPCKSLADCAALLKTAGARAAVLELTQLQAFWLSIMTDKTNSVAQRLQASKYYADSIGGFSPAPGAGSSGFSVRWGSSAPIDAEIEEEKN